MNDDDKESILDRLLEWTIISIGVILVIKAVYAILHYQS